MPILLFGFVFDVSDTHFAFIFRKFLIGIGLAARF